MKVALLLPEPSEKPTGIHSYCNELIPRLQELLEETKVFYAQTYKLEDIADYAPDLLYIEHQYGLYPREDNWKALLRAFPSHLVKLHNAFERSIPLLDQEESAEYLGSIQSVIVHSKNMVPIVASRVKGRIEVIPHGCPDYEPPEFGEALKEQTLFGFGFNFPYKGYSEALEIHKIVQRGNPPHNFYQVFSSLLTLKAIAHVSAVGLLPYSVPDPRCSPAYGASGAVRQTMAWGLPVVTSTVPLFSDVSGITLSGTNVAEMADATAALLRSAALREEVCGKQKEYVETYSWDSVAHRHLFLF